MFKNVCLSDAGSFARRRHPTVSIISQRTGIELMPKPVHTHPFSFATAARINQLRSPSSQACPDIVSPDVYCRAVERQM